MRSGGTSATTPPWPTLASLTPCGLATSTLVGNVAVPDAGLSTISEIVRRPCQVTWSSGFGSAEPAIQGVSSRELNRLSGPYCTSESRVELAVTRKVDLLTGARLLMRRSSAAPGVATAVAVMPTHCAADAWNVRASTWLAWAEPGAAAGEAACCWKE